MDESTEHFRVILKTRSLVIYDFDELTKLFQQVQNLQESNMVLACPTE